MKKSKEETEDTFSFHSRKFIIHVACIIIVQYNIFGMTTSIISGIICSPKLIDFTNQNSYTKNHIQFASEKSYGKLKMQTVNLLKPVGQLFHWKNIIQKLTGYQKEIKRNQEKTIYQKCCYQNNILLYTQSRNVHILLLNKGRGMLRYTLYH